MAPPHRTSGREALGCGQRGQVHDPHLADWTPPRRSRREPSPHASSANFSEGSHDGHAERVLSAVKALLATREPTLEDRMRLFLRLDQPSPQHSPGGLPAKAQQRASPKQPAPATPQPQQRSGGRDHPSSSSRQPWSPPVLQGSCQTPGRSSLSSTTAGSARSALQTVGSSEPCHGPGAEEPGSPPSSARGPRPRACGESDGGAAAQAAEETPRRALEPGLDAAALQLEDCAAWCRLSASASTAGQGGLSTEDLHRLATAAVEAAAVEAAAVDEAAAAEGAVRGKGRKRKDGWTVVQRRQSSRRPSGAAAGAPATAAARSPATALAASIAARPRSLQPPRRRAPPGPPRGPPPSRDGSLAPRLPARHLTVHQQTLRSMSRGQVASAAQFSATERTTWLETIQQRPFSLYECYGEFPVLSSKPAPRGASRSKSCSALPSAARGEAYMQLEAWQAPEANGTEAPVEAPSAEETCSLCLRPLSVSPCGTLCACRHSFHLRCLARQQSEESSAQCFVCGVPFEWNCIERLQMAPTARQELARSVFQALRPEGTSGVLHVGQTRRFAGLTGFQGDDSEWRQEFGLLCRERGLQPRAGINERTFLELVDNTGLNGCYCSDEELQDILSKLGEANAAREASVSQLFQELAEGGESLGGAAMRRLVELCGCAQVSDEDWIEEYDILCRDHGCIPAMGFDEAALWSFLDAGLGEGSHVNDEDLVRILLDLRWQEDEALPEVSGALEVHAPSSGSSCQKAAEARRPRARRAGTPARALPAPAAPPAPAGREGRAELATFIFDVLDVSSSGHLDCQAMKRFAEFAGFRGSEAAWRREFGLLCGERGLDVERGVDVGTFLEMVNDFSEQGIYCSERELAAIRAALLQEASMQRPSRAQRERTPRGRRS